jgi:hypothetical protein
VFVLQIARFLQFVFFINLFRSSNRTQLDLLFCLIPLEILLVPHAIPFNIKTHFISNFPLTYSINILGYNGIVFFRISFN